MKAVWLFLLLAVGCGRQPVTITYPLDGTVFPPDGAPPTVRWEGEGRVVRAGDFEVRVTGRSWTPTVARWDAIKKRGGGTLRVGEAQVSYTIASEPVGAPLFYREVVLPFAEAVKDPSQLRWRFGSVSSLQPPPTVLEGLPVCANCHSFSRDGRVLGMDVDYANDKGSYAVVPVGREMALKREQIITWSDYRRDDGELTFGLLAQISPDGRYVVSTVKDRSVFMAKPDLAFSQIFFPIKGILAIYDRETGKFAPLLGADDRAFVQSNPSWSPDGQHIVFARAPAEDLKNLKHPESALVTAEEAAEFFARRPRYMFDIYRLPASGGKPEPVLGASHNGASNFFPRYSPDGKWIVFCRAKNYMLLQPDSELWIVPAAGGEARRMRCNTGRMNSWHSWSPNGRWLVFASKANGPYTQMWLTHVDENGNDSPPVVLDRLTASDRAANIPEFVNAPADAISRIQERFMDDLSFVRAGTDLFNGGDAVRAEAMFRRAIGLNPSNDVAQFCLGNVLAAQARLPEALQAFHRAEKLTPRAMYACRQGQVLRELKQLPEARAVLERAVQLDAGNAEAQVELGKVLHALGDPHGAVAALRAGVKLAPQDASYRYALAVALTAGGELAEAESEAKTARSLAGGSEQARQIEGLLNAIRKRGAPSP